MRVSLKTLAVVSVIIIVVAVLIGVISSEERQAIQGQIVFNETRLEEFEDIARMSTDNSMPVLVEREPWHGHFGYVVKIFSPGSDFSDVPSSIITVNDTRQSSRRWSDLIGYAKANGSWESDWHGKDIKDRTAQDEEFTKGSIRFYARGIKATFSSRIPWGSVGQDGYEIYSSTEFLFPISWEQIESKEPSSR